MTKLTDFQCPNCGVIEEHFEDETIMCECRDDFGLRVLMKPIFTPKNNSQRARVND